MHTLFHGLCGAQNSPRNKNIQKLGGGQKVLIDSIEIHIFKAG